MTNAVQNQEDKNNPYTDWGQHANSGFGAENYLVEDMQYGLIGGGRRHQEVLSVEQERERITYLLQRDDLSTSSIDDLESLQNKLNYIASITDPEALNQALAEVDATLDAMENPKSGKDLSLTDQIQNYLTEHPDLEDDQKEKLEKWIATIELDASTEKLISKEFEDFQEKATSEAVYGSKMTDLAAATGMKIEDIEAALKKHGLSDLENLNNDQIAALLPDLGGERLSSARENLRKAESSLLKAWDEASKQSYAESIDIANGEDVKGSSASKTIQELANNEASQSKAYEKALCGVANATKSILAVLKGVPEDQVEVMTGAPEMSSEDREAIDGVLAGLRAIGGNFTVPTLDTGKTLSGCLSIDGEIYNVAPDSTTGVVKLGKDSNEWPEFDVGSTQVETCEEGDPAGAIVGAAFLGPFGLLF